MWVLLFVGYLFAGLLMVNMTATVTKMCPLLQMLYGCNTCSENPHVKHIIDIYSGHFWAQCNKGRQRCFVAWWTAKQRVTVQTETDEQAVCTSINTGVFTSLSPISCEPFFFYCFSFFFNLWLSVTCLLGCCLAPKALFFLLWFLQIQ